MSPTATATEADAATPSSQSEVGGVTVAGWKTVPSSLQSAVPSSPVTSRRAPIHAAARRSFVVPLTRRFQTRRSELA